MSYQFDTYELDAKRAELRRSGTPLKLESKVYLLLEILLVHHDRVVSKDEIIKHVWAGRIVSDGSIDNTLSTARKAIGDNGKTQKLIKTFPGTGFRFIGDVKVTSDNKQTIDNTTQDASIAVLPFVDMSAPRRPKISRRRYSRGAFKCSDKHWQSQCCVAYISLFISR